MICQSPIDNVTCGIKMPRNFRVLLADDLARIHRTHDDEAGDDESQGDKGNEEDAAPTGGEFATDDPVLRAK